jgi:Ca-activated chloride channel family protein
MRLANESLVLFVSIVFIIFSFLVIFSYYLRGLFRKSLFSKSQQKLVFSNLNENFRLARFVSLILAFFFVSFAVLDPRWGTKNLQAEIEGIDVVFVMDISRSMATKDVVPSRLDLAKKLSVQLLSLLAGNRVGMTAFSGFAFNVIPLTADIDAAMVFLNELSFDMIDVAGSNLEDSLRKALGLFEKDALTHKAIVLFTDGEDYEFSPRDQVKIAKEMGVSLFTVGLGTPNGASIPLFDEKGNFLDYLKKDNKIVISKLNENLLKRMAEETRGLYFSGNEDSIVALSKKLNEIKKSRFGNNVFEFMEPQYQYFLLIGVLFLFIFLFLPERRLVFTKKTALSLVIFFTFFCLANRSFSSDASEGVREYKKGNYEEALKHFQKSVVKSPEDKKLIFNEGNAFYQLKNYDEAANSYSGLTNSSDQNLRQKSLYNLGNAFLERKDFGGAASAYRDVLSNEKEGNVLYKKALQNLLYAKQQQREQQNQSDSKNDQKKNGQKQDKNKADQKNQSNSQKQKPQNEDQQKSTKPLTQNDVQNLLNLIEEDEKKHLRKKQRDKTIRVYPKNEW